MFGRKIQQFLLILIATVTIMAGVLTLLLTGADRFSAQAQSNVLAPVSVKQPAPSLVREQQQIYTSTFELTSGRLTTEDVQAIVFGDSGGSGSAGLLTGQDVLVDEGCVTDPGTGQVNISPSAYRHAELSPASEFRFWPEGGYIYSTSAISTMQLVAPVSLPQGVTLTHVAKVFFDNESTNVVVRLLRKNLASPGNAREQIAGYFSSSTSAQQVLCASNSSGDFAPGTAVISSNFSYFTVLEFPANADLDLEQLELGVKIYYEPLSVASPTVITETVPIAAFRHNGDNANNSVLYYNIIDDNIIDAYIRSSGTVTPELVAPIYPPNGAALTQFRISVRDVITTSNGQDITAKLHRVKLDTGSVDLISQISTSVFDETGPNIQIIANETFIDIPATGLENVSSDFSYYITLTLPSNPGDTIDVLFFGARVIYTLP